MATADTSQDRAEPVAPVYVGVDTHADLHHAAIVDPLGRALADQAFPTTPAGYRALLRWASDHGDLAAFGIEGTSCYGAVLTRDLMAAGHRLIEVDRPDRKSRRLKGKSDPLDSALIHRARRVG